MLRVVCRSMILISTSSLSVKYLARMVLLNYLLALALGFFLALSRLVV
jgi:hypothetical protein